MAKNMTNYIPRVTERVPLQFFHPISTTPFDTSDGFKLFFPKQQKKISFSAANATLGKGD